MYGLIRKGRSNGILEKVITGEIIYEKIVVIVAHQDDETIGIASRLCKFRNMTLIYTTDGAPRNLERAKALGFESAEDYSKARFAELRRALSILNVKPACLVTFKYPDGETVYNLPSLIDRVQREISGAAAVLTHAYEGGHPDHDACALATQIACDRIVSGPGHVPLHLEFAEYFCHNGKLVANGFLPNATDYPSAVRLSWSELRRKRRAMSAFVTQSFILSEFPPKCEAYRNSPRYDFNLPPPSGEWYYNQHHWSLTGDRWLDQVRDVLEFGRT
jgi:N-acetylglucosamine malate deacetylase 2